MSTLPSIAFLLNSSSPDHSAQLMRSTADDAHVPNKNSPTSNQKPILPPCLTRHALLPRSQLGATAHPHPRYPGSAGELSHSHNTSEMSAAHPALLSGQSASDSPLTSLPSTASTPAILPPCLTRPHLLPSHAASYPHPHYQAPRGSLSEAPANSTSSSGRGRSSTEPEPEAESELSALFAPLRNAFSGSSSGSSVFSPIASVFSSITEPLSRYTAAAFCDNGAESNTTATTSLREQDTATPPACSQPTFVLPPATAMSVNASGRLASGGVPSYTTQLHLPSYVPSAGVPVSAAAKRPSAEAQEADPESLMANMLVHLTGAAHTQAQAQTLPRPRPRPASQLPLPRPTLRTAPGGTVVPGVVAPQFKHPYCNSSQVTVPSSPAKKSKRKSKRHSSRSGRPSTANQCNQRLADLEALPVNPNALGFKPSVCVVDGRKLRVRKVAYKPRPTSGRRQRTTSEQRDLLMAAFETNPMPSPEMKRELAQRLGMNHKRVQVWFQNRRAEYKREQREAAELRLQQQLQRA